MEIQQLKEYLKLYWNHWPVCAVYSACLDLAQSKFSLSREELRQRYGLYCGMQWYDLLFNKNKHCDYENESM
jgi:hypothetical protein